MGEWINKWMDRLVDKACMKDDCAFCGGGWVEGPTGAVYVGSLHRWWPQMRAFSSGDKVPLGCPKLPATYAGPLLASVWDPKYVRPPAGPTNAAKTGFNCIRCKTKNDYAVSNQKDGTYVCYECR